jgi:hypothetical protein
MINDEIFPMNRGTTFYKCDPSKNADCRKTTCQNECKFTTKAECSCDGKKYRFNVMTWEFEEILGDE